MHLLCISAYFCLYIMLWHVFLQQSPPHLQATPLCTWSAKRMQNKPLRVFTGPRLWGVNLQWSSQKYSRPQTRSRVPCGAHGHFAGECPINRPSMEHHQSQAAVLAAAAAAAAGLPLQVQQSVHNSFYNTASSDPTFAALKDLTTSRVDGKPVSAAVYGALASQVYSSVADQVMNRSHVRMATPPKESHRRALPPLTLPMEQIPLFTVPIQLMGPWDAQSVTPKLSLKPLGPDSLSRTTSAGWTSRQWPNLTETEVRYGVRPHYCLIQFPSSSPRHDPNDGPCSQHLLVVQNYPQSKMETQLQGEGILNILQHK